MSTFGVQPTGFVIKRLADIISSLKTSLQSVTDSNGNTLSVDTEDSTLISQLTMIFAEELSEAWAMAGALANQFDPNFDIGVFQSGTVQLNGIFRMSAVPTQLNVTLAGAAGAIIPAGSGMAYNNNGFNLDANVVIGAVPVAIGTITISSEPSSGSTIVIGGVTYTISSGSMSVAFRINQLSNTTAQALAIAEAINVISGQGSPGTDFGTGTYANPYVTAVALGNVVTLTAITPGSVGNTIVLNASDTGVVCSGGGFLAGGAPYGTGTGTATSTSTSPVAVPNVSALSITTPVAGWTSALCSSTAVAGVDIESDEALRTRQQLSTSFTAAREADAILAAINNVSGVTFSQLYENPSLIVDGNSLPAGSVCAVVLGGVDGDVCDAIYSRLSCMTQTFGNTSKDYAAISVLFERPVPVTIGVTIVVSQRNSSFPADYATQVKNAIVAWAASPEGYGPGQTVYANDLYDALEELPGMSASGATVGSSGSGTNPIQATGWIRLNNAKVATLGSTVTVGSITYTFGSSPLNTANLVLFDPTDKTKTAQHLFDAINATAGQAGVGYGTGTTANTDVNASTRVGATVNLVAAAVHAGSLGNTLSLTTSNSSIVSLSGSTLAGGRNATGSTFGKTFAIAWNQIANFDVGDIAVTRPLATGTISLLANPIATDTIVINGVTYTFQTTVTASTGNGVTGNMHVLIGPNTSGTALNLMLAINAAGTAGTGTSGINYGTSTVANTFVAATSAGGVITITSILAGATIPNAYTLTASWGTPGNVSLSGATLSGGEGA